MRLGPEHARAWGYWHTPEVLRRLGKLQPPDIHELVNRHAGPRPKVHHADAEHLVRLKRSNARHDRQPVDMAAVLAPSQWCRENAPKRYHQMRRWLRALLAHRKQRPLRNI